MNAKRPPPLFPLRHSKSLRFQLPGRSLNLMTISERDGSPSNMSPSNTSASQSSPRTPRSPRSVDDSGTATTAMLAAVGEDMELPGKIKPPPLVMFAPNSNLVLQRGETIDTTNDRLLRQALSRLFEPAEFTEITGLDMADYRLVYKLEDRFVASTSKFASLEDPPTPGVWVAKLLVIAIQRVANAALVFKSACEQLSNLCRRAVMLCTEGTMSGHAMGDSDILSARAQQRLLPCLCVCMLACVYVCVCVCVCVFLCSLAVALPPVFRPHDAHSEAPQGGVPLHQGVQPTVVDGIFVPAPVHDDCTAVCDA